jgi:hypothetical protein
MSAYKTEKLKKLESYIRTLKLGKVSYESKLNVIKSSLEKVQLQIKQEQDYIERMDFKD